jgi:hypothetical protein
LWKKTICVWVGYYYANWVKFNIPFGPQKDLSTSPPTYVQEKPYPATTLFATADPSDLGIVLFTLLQSGSKYFGKNISFVAEAKSEHERLDAWGRGVGVKAVFKEISPEEYSAKMAEAGMPLHIVQNVTEQLLLIKSGNYMGNSEGDVVQAADVSTTVKTPL